MRTDIRFSIVIPTYNRADLIIETLESVFSQSYSNYEVIVVDNCSTDNTVSLLEPLVREGKIKFIKHERNFERSKSRNTGMENASGDFLTFLDSDDFMYTDCLNDACVFIENNPQYKFIHNLYELVNNKRERIYSFRFPSLKNPYKALASGNFISCIGGFIHRDIYKAHRFTEDPKMIGSEDYEVWFEILAKYPLGRVPKVNSGIREHPNRSVNTGIYDNLEYQRQRLVHKITATPLLFDKFGPYIPRLNASFFLQQSIVLKDLNRRYDAVRNVIKAFKSDWTIMYTKRFYGVIYNYIR